MCKQQECGVIDSQPHSLLYGSTLYYAKLCQIKPKFKDTVVGEYDTDVATFFRVEKA